MLFGLIKRKHKHKWEKKFLLNKEHAMVWYLRVCECGAKEMLHAGGTGDGKWHPLDENYKFRLDYEAEWFNDAKAVKGL